MTLEAHLTNDDRSNILIYCFPRQFIDRADNVKGGYLLDTQELASP